MADHNLEMGLFTEENFDAKIKMQKTGRRVNWNKSFSPYDYRLSEVISAVGKEIRRGEEELSAFWAYQMMISGAEAEEFLWERFRIITIEDIGLANPNALLIVGEAKRLYYELPSKHFDRFSTGIFTTSYLARSPKTRYTHEMLSMIKGGLKDGTMTPEIPDYALDFHFPQHREKGRDLLHYLTEGAKLANEDTTFPTKYREWLIKRVKEGM
tara:strand:+ start:2233 stop:2868 length:636 start_codon:yes stop_codon:yes gene_type:complete